MRPWKFQHLHMNFFSLKRSLTLNYILGYFQVLVSGLFDSPHSQMPLYWSLKFKKSELNSDSIPFVFLRS